ncbi:MAG: DsrE family protein [Candidatus Njordarchaeia archaeon]
MADKMVILVNNGTIDRLIGMAVLASGGIANDMEVHIYLMLWGVYAFLKKNLETNKEIIEHHDKAGELEQGLKNAGLKPWYEMLKELKEMGNLKIHVCGAAAKAWGASLEDIYLADDMCGASEMAEAAAEAKVSIMV